MGWDETPQGRIPVTSHLRRLLSAVQGSDSRCQYAGQMVIEDIESVTRTSHSGRRPVSQLVMVLAAGAVVMIVVAGVLIDWSLQALGASVAAYLAAAVVAVVSMRRGFAFPSLGLGNTVTLGRLALVAALVAPLFAQAPPWGVISVALAALFLDGFDGWLARREQRVSSFGARLDMEVDSALALVLALNAMSPDALGVWILLLGLPRYLFVAVGLFFRWLTASLPDSATRKVICVIQVGALVTLQLPGLWTWFVVAVLVAVGGLLVWSFGRDIVWLWRATA